MSCLNHTTFSHSGHSTASPLGVLPDPAITRIVTGDKFSEEGVQIVEEEDTKTDENSEEKEDEKQ